MLLTDRDRDHILTAPNDLLREDLAQAVTRGDKEFASAIAHELVKRANPTTHPANYGEPELEQLRRLR